MRKLFTERHGEAKPRVSETLDITTRDGLLNLASSYIEQDWLGLKFPEKCRDGFPYAGTDTTRLRGIIHRLPCDMAVRCRARRFARRWSRF
jgi:hypothetical protein